MWRLENTNESQNCGLSTPRGGVAEAALVLTVIVGMANKSKAQVCAPSLFSLETQMVNHQHGRYMRRPSVRSVAVSHRPRAWHTQRRAGWGTQPVALRPLRAPPSTVTSCVVLGRSKRRCEDRCAV